MLVLFRMLYRIVAGHDHQAWVMANFNHFMDGGPQQFECEKGLPTKGAGNVKAAMADLQVRTKMTKSAF
jgi:hypothetical protein